MITYDELLDRMKREFALYAGFLPESQSDLEIRLRVLAGELYSAFAHMDWLERQAFPQTADGQYLTMHGVQRGLVRKQAQPAVGTLTFSVGSALGYDLVIPEGTVCAVDMELETRYVTTAEATLSADALSVTVDARTVQAGCGANTPAGTVTVMVTPPPGIDAVTNDVPFTGGTDSENDDLFRQRLLDRYAQAPNGANSAFYRDVAMRDPDVHSAGVVPRENGVGTVSVYIAVRGGVAVDDVVARVQAQLDRIKELNVDVSVKPAVLNPIALRFRIKPAAEYSFDRAKQLCLQVIDDYFQRMYVGSTFRLAELCRDLLDSGAIVNYYTLPGEDYAMQQNQLPTKGVVTIEEGANLS